MAKLYILLNPFLKPTPDAYILNYMKELIVRNFIEGLLEVQINNIKRFRNRLQKALYRTLVDSTNKICCYGNYVASPGLANYTLGIEPLYLE